MSDRRKPSRNSLNRPGKNFTTWSNSTTVCPRRVPDLSDTFVPTFSPVLVDTLRKTLDSEFDLLRQLQSVHFTSPGATTSTDREETTPASTTPSSLGMQTIVFRTPEASQRAVNTITVSSTELWERSGQMDRLKEQLQEAQSDLVKSENERRRLESRVQELSAQLDQVQPQLEKSRHEKEAADRQLQEVATQLEFSQREQERVWTQADLKAAFADLDVVHL
ncbi:hypothetical protein R1flu_009082 [Riccia fluitans]|uniref:Uncharacterized protein n=1 Tax=Riccia fluitans TaxID=41844 RepID=A0ABD1Z1W6_9MARC